LREKGRESVKEEERMEGEGFDREREREVVGEKWRKSESLTFYTVMQNLPNYPSSIVRDYAGYYRD